MSHNDYKALLGFTDQWFSLGIVSEEGLQQYGATYETSGDKNAEHYRYGAFRWYLKEHRPLPEPMAEALYELGASDPDSGMGGAMMADIIDLPECPASVSAKALMSGRKHLLRTAERRRLLLELQQAVIPAETFIACLRSGDSAVHRALLKQVSLSTEQLQILAEQGASRAVRNIAAGKLGRSGLPLALAERNNL